MITKTCRDCGVLLIVGENWTEGASKNYTYLCRGCVSARGIAHYKKHSEKYDQMQRERLKRQSEAKLASEYKSAYYARNREKWKEYDKVSKKKTSTSPWHKAGRLITWVRVRAARHKYEFDLTRDWAEQKLESGVCEVTGIEFNFSKESAGVRFNPFGPSVDRIYSNRGYTQDNFRMVVWIYNMAKSEWDDDTVLKMARKLVEKNQ